MNLARAPLYARAEAALRACIASGRWPPGAPLPPEPALAAEFGISQGTLRRALAGLERQRLIDRRQGVGTYVAEATSERALFHFFRLEELGGTRPTPTSLVQDFSSRPARAGEAGPLGLEPQARLHALRRLRMVGGQAVIAEDILLPAALFPGFTLPVGVELTDELYVLYQRRHGVTVLRVDEHISAQAAPEGIAQALGCAPGMPLLHVERLATDLLGRPVERRLSWMETGRLRYAITLA